MIWQTGIRLWLQVGIDKNSVRAAAIGRASQRELMTRGENTAESIPDFKSARGLAGGLVRSATGQVALTSSVPSSPPSVISSIDHV